MSKTTEHNNVAKSGADQKQYAPGLSVTDGPKTPTRSSAPTVIKDDIETAAPARIKERPILFSAAMVRAILNGQKTQTRRVMGQPFLPAEKLALMDGKLCQHVTAEQLAKIKFIGPAPEPGWVPLVGGKGPGGRGNPVVCPYGQPGERLWVRESLRFTPDGCTVYYDADRQSVSEEANRRFMGRDFVRDYVPSIHMPRWASRLTLEITDVRVERVQDISEADAKAEGSYLVRCDCLEMKRRARTPIEAAFQQTYCHIHGEEFQALWTRINGAQSWDANPWVWVVSFKRV